MLLIINIPMVNVPIIIILGQSLATSSLFSEEYICYPVIHRIFRCYLFFPNPLPDNIIKITTTCFPTNAELQILIITSIIAVIIGTIITSIIMNPFHCNC